MRRNVLIEAVVLLAIIALGAWFRLVHLRENPDWFTDEGTHLNIAGHLLDSNIQYMAVGDSTLFFARLPLFEIVLAGSMFVFGEDILTLRTLTAMLGIISIFVLWWVTRRLTSPVLAMLAALMLAIYPQAILYSRFGFSYNFLAPLVLLVVSGLVAYPEHRCGLWLTVLAISIGGISDLMMFTMLAPAAFIVVSHQWRDIWKLGLALLSFGLYGSIMLLSVPDSFLYDLAYTKGRLDGAPIDDQLWNVIETYTVLLSQDFWFLGGLIGLSLLIDTRFGKVPFLVLVIPVILLARTVPLYHLSAYYLIPLLPLIALGMAVLVHRGAPFLVARITQDGENNLVSKGFGWLIAISLVAAPLVYTVDLFAWYAQTDWITGIDPFLVEPRDVELAVAALNLEDGDSVLVSPGVAWLLPDRVNAVDFSMGSARIESNTVYFWGDAHMALERFRYDPRYTHADYAIVDPLWHEWGAPSIKGVADMIDVIENRWRLLRIWGEVEVYENPAH